MKALFPTAALLLALSADQPPTPSVPAGTHGVVRTILEGDRIQDIPVRFLGLYRGAAGPGHDLYLVRLEGDDAERVMDRAKAALRTAVQQGRNRTHVRELPLVAARS